MNYYSNIFDEGHTWLLQVHDDSTAGVPAPDAVRLHGLPGSGVGGVPGGRRANPTLLIHPRLQWRNDAPQVNL